MTREDLNIVYGYRWYALKLSGCKNDADDIMQEVAVAVLRNYDRFQDFPEHGKKNYVMTCVGSKFIDMKRKVQTKQRKDCYLVEKIQPHGMHAKMDLKDVQKVWSKIEMCDALKLYATGYQAKEIAVMMGVSINTALGRMRYGRIHLRKQLQYEQK